MEQAGGERRTMPHRAFIGVGSNLGDRKANIAEALDRVGKLANSRIVRTSSLYESEPHGNAKTWFVNAAFELETEFSASELLKRLKAIEQAMGRKRVKGKKWGSRIIDLDILFFDSEVVSSRDAQDPAPAGTGPALRPPTARRGRPTAHAPGARPDGLADPRHDQGREARHAHASGLSRLASLSTESDRDSLFALAA